MAAKTINNSIKYLSLPAFKAEVGITMSQKAFAAKWKSLGLAPDRLVDDDAAGTTHNLYVNHDDGRSSVLVVIGLIEEKLNVGKDIKNYADLVNLLTHEAVHAWQYITAYIEENECGDEIEAYNIGYVTEFLFKEVVQVIKNPPLISAGGRRKKTMKNNKTGQS